ncbi:Hexaprenyldihydroxybenzoate methyltransferase, mitochondrial [Chamberlinius hualienensis]
MQNLRVLFIRDFNSSFRTLARQYSDQSSQTVVKDEVLKFSEYASKWWDPNGPTKTLQTFNMKRVPFITESILNNPSQPSSGPKSENRNGPETLKGFKLIDIGCGAGLLSEALAKLGADTTGLDAGKDLIDVARRHASLNPNLSKNLRYVNTTVEDHVNENSSSYDALTCSEVIEHVNNPEFFVKQCVKLVKPGGSLVFTTMNRTLLSGFIVIFLAEYLIKEIPKGTHQYNMFIRPEDLEKMLKSNNCDIRKTQGLLALPTRTWITVPTSCVHYAMHAVKTTA